ncbi:serine/threonine kinase [Geitlerinema sp. FC II]|nr:caspase family protein [Geitlerinema sp. CS-897]PPT10312.1 serine/threonine kinase [Geitlerinema sp. FC II]
MGELWCLAIGVDRCNSLQPLRYATEDAQALRDCLVDAGVAAEKRVWLMTQRSPDSEDFDSFPSLENLDRLLDRLASQPIPPGDGLWVFFSGYALNHAGRDYFMLADSNPDKVSETALSAKLLFDRLSSFKSDRVVVFLDCDRPTAPHTGQDIGSEIAQLAETTGISVVFSCQPHQHSRETRYLHQGLFTAALLEALQHHRCRTFAQLEDYLSQRLPQLAEHHRQPPQTPRFVVTSPGRSLFPEGEVSDVAEVPAAPPTSSEEPKTSLAALWQLMLTLAVIPALLMVGVVFSPDSSDVEESSDVEASSEPPVNDTRQLLETAKAAIDPTQASSYWRAIDTLKQVPPTATGYPQVREQIDVWSWEILKLARTRAENGNLDGAIATARLVPPETAAYETAQVEMRRWGDAR